MLGVWLFTLSLVLVSAVGWLGIAPKIEPLSDQPWPWWVLILLFVVGKHIRVVLATTRSQPVTLVMTDAALVVALLLAEPRVIPIGIATAAFSSALLKRPKLIKAAFNIAQELAGGFLGLVTFEILRDGSLVSARSGIAALAGGIAVGVFSHQAVAAVTRLASGTAQRAPMRSLLLSSLGSIGNGVVALQAVALGSISPVDYVANSPKKPSASIPR